MSHHQQVREGSLIKQIACSVCSLKLLLKCVSQLSVGEIIEKSQLWGTSHMLQVTGAYVGFSALSR